MNKKELIKKLKEREDKISKATKIRALITKQKALWKAKQGMTNFEEPVLFLYRRSGMLEFYEKATAGKFIYEHSNGGSRYSELRPSDQCTFSYGDKRIRCYILHEDFPFAGFPNPEVDGESVMIGYEKTKAADLKYQKSLEELKYKGKLTWVWIVLGICGGIAILMFAYNQWLQPAMAKSAIEQATKTTTKVIAPTLGAMLIKIKSRK